MTLLDELEGELDEAKSALNRALASYERGDARGAREAITEAIQRAEWADKMVAAAPTLEDTLAA